MLAMSEIRNSNSIERRHCIPKKENVLHIMAGRMSACGKLGLTKYGEKSVKDWTNRTYYICEDIMPKRFNEMKDTKAKLNNLENCAINKP